MILPSINNKQKKHADFHDRKKATKHKLMKKKHDKREKIALQESIYRHKSKKEIDKTNQFTKHLPLKVDVMLITMNTNRLEEFVFFLKIRKKNFLKQNFTKSKIKLLSYCDE